ncbi:hypothetical protein ANTQUA_LOCUS5770 [Anthophora quadrimaculata]
MFQYLIAAQFGRGACPHLPHELFFLRQSLLPREEVVGSLPRFFLCFVASRASVKSVSSNFSVPLTTTNRDISLSDLVL